MTSIAQRLREGAARRDKQLDKLRSQKKIVNPIRTPLTIEDMERKLQEFEAFKQGVLAGQMQLSHAPQLVIPQANGQLISSAQHQLEERAKQILPNIWAEKRWHEQQVAKEDLEEVTNFLDDDYVCVINFVGYTVPARSTKKLPRSLAEHFRHKMSLLERNEKFQKRTGEQDFGKAGEGPNFMSFPKFAHEVKSFDRSYDDVDPGTRTVYY